MTDQTTDYHEPLGLQYQRLVNQFGLDSPEALDFRKTHRSDNDFCETADILDRLFRNRARFSRRLTIERSRKTYDRSRTR